MCAYVSVSVHCMYEGEREGERNHEQFCRHMYVRKLLVLFCMQLLGWLSNFVISCLVCYQ